MRSNCSPDSGVRIQNMCMCGVYLVVVPEPFFVSQSWGGGVTGDLQIKQVHDICKPGSLVFIVTMQAQLNNNHLHACSQCLYHLLIGTGGTNQLKIRHYIMPLTMRCLTQVTYGMCYEVPNIVVIMYTK